MIEIFELIALSTIWVLGLTIVTQNDMMLEHLRFWAQAKKDQGAWFMEPVILCHWCMPSVHSVFAYFFLAILGGLNYRGWDIVICYPIVVMGTSLASGLIWTTYLTMNAKKEYLESGKVLHKMKCDEIAGLFDPELYNSLEN